MSGIKGKVKFINADGSEFFAVLRSRVENYFSQNGISKNANAAMVFKTIFMLTLFFVPYLLMLSNLFTPWIDVALFLFMGIGVSGIGLSVMHDANHGSYSASPAINSFLSYTMELVGGSGYNWRIKHNILHHTYTNINGMDDDLNAGIIVRFSPEQKKLKLHRYQHIYSWFLYGMLTLLWVTASDFMGLIKYTRRGLNKGGLPIPVQFLKLFALKVVYFGYIFALPLLLTDIAWWQLLIGFVGMHFIAGLILSSIFLCAHIVEEADYPVPDVDGTIKNEWAIHQLFTTANFARANKFLTWFIGGLNYQVEHHLFPKVCHVHYPKLSLIVQQTAREFKLPYHAYPTFTSALISHHRVLKRLGR